MPRILSLLAGVAVACWAASAAAQGEEERTDGGTPDEVPDVAWIEDNA
jgi:hypothetical protein